MVDFAKLREDLSARRALGPTLTIKRGKFQLLNPSALQEKELRLTSEWLSCGMDAYETQSLRAAAGFRRIADEKARKFFDQSFQALYPLPSVPPLPFLDPHQRAGVEWQLTRKRSYLAHAPGAGKTAQAICAGVIARSHEDHDRGQYPPGEMPPLSPIVVLCPPGLTLNWAREIRKFWPKIAEALGLGVFWEGIGIVGRTEDQDRVLWRGDFLIVPHSMLCKDWVYTRLRELNPQFIIVDEASALKESTTDRSLAFYGGRYKGTDFPGLYQKARHVVFMDGSPMPNRPMELWAPTYALVPDAIDCLPQRDFGFRYCGGRMNERGEYEFKYSSNEAELRQRLRANFMHVVTEDQLDHPERRRSMLFMDEDVRTPTIKTWERRNLSKVLKMIDAGEDEPTQGELAEMRREVGLRKMPWIVRYVRDRLERKNESILLFAWHREVCEHLYWALNNPIWHTQLVYGGTSPAAREAAFSLFQEGGCKLIIGNIAAMGRGHNLQRADRVIFAEYAWSDETNKQAEKRASRRGSKKAFVRCEYIVSPGSMDEQVLASLFAKQSRVKKVIG